MDRFKDADPKDTVERIQGILESLDINIQEYPGNFEERFYSVRIVDSNTGAASNGKGASEALSRASAYGEYMERLQNGFLVSRSYNDEEIDSYCGFRIAPDEEIVSFDEAISALSFIAGDLDRAFAWKEPQGLADPAAEKRKAAFEYWRGKVGDTCSMVPYYSVARKESVMLPDDIIFSMCASNGLASGNSPEEALCEGMSELCERIAKYAIRDKRLCPPKIPWDFIEREMPEQAQMMRFIEEKTPDLKLIPMDASMGQGLPVVCLVFINQAKGSVRCKFGAHPVMAIALERCMTEHFQGYGLQVEDTFDSVFTPWDRWSRLDTCDFVLDSPMAASDQGAVRDRMLLSTPDWDFVPWGSADSFDNKKGVAYLTQVLREIGGDVFVRATGYLGVPSYRIYVPKVSYAGYVRGDVIDRYVKIQRELSFPVACAACAYEEGDLELAAKFLNMKKDTRRYACAAQELLCRAEGMPESMRDELLEIYFGSNAASYAKTVWRSDDVVKALVDHTEGLAWLLTFGKKRDTSEKAKKREARIALYRKLKERLRDNPLDQELLCQIFE